jgi:SAGA-associated factor 73
MTLKLKRISDSPPPFSWDALPSPPAASDLTGSLPSPPTSWLSARDMKMFGAEPLKADIGVVKCKVCDKPVLRSAMADHAGEYSIIMYAEGYCGSCSRACTDNCKLIQSGGKKGAKGKSADAEGTVIPD